jgi:hypothetical protein
MGLGTDICTVTLSAASASSGLSVRLSSSNAAVALPAAATVPANATSLQFIARVSSSETAQVATLMASAGGVSKSFVLKLNAAVRTMSSVSSVIFDQNVAVNTAATQFVTLTSTGAEAVTIEAAVLTGKGFNVSGVTFPITLNPGQTATLSVQFNPTVAGVATGQITISSNSSSTGTTVISLSGTAIRPSGAGTPSASFAYGGSPLASTLVPASPSTVISSDFFGMTIYNLASNVPGATSGLTAFPPYQLSTLRLWDVAYWAFLEPADGQFNWTKMDGTIAVGNQNGVKDFIFTFGQTPRWASTNPTDPCTNGEGPGTCSPPDLNAYDDFATHVVQRYCGKVKYYEPWNEPNNPPFWDGNNAQMLTLAQHTYRIAKDPANCGCTNGSCSPNGGVNPNQVLLPPIAGIGTPSIAWLDSYLASAGTPYPYADIASFHGYIWSGYPPEAIAPEIQSLRQILAKYGLSSLELWNTETSWGEDTNFDAQQQASWLMRSYIAEEAAGVSRYVWYAYDACGWGTLALPLSASTACNNSLGTADQLTPGGLAYSTIEDWLIGASLPQCQEYQNGLWACELQRSGNYDAWVLWSGTGASILVPIPENFGLTVYRDSQNNLNTVPTQLTVTEMPILLESQDL